MNVRGGHHRFGATALLLLATIAGRDAFAGQLTLTWVDNSSDEAGFSVERGSSAAGPFAEIGTLGPGATALTDSGLGDATTYCYRVRAFSAAAYSDYSNVACGRTPQVFGLAVVKTGGGNGSVLSTPSGIACGASCSGSYPSGTAVSLSAAPGPGSIFSGWGGACSGTGACAVFLSASTVVTAAFDPPPSPLTVSKVGSGGGKIVSTPAGIKCGAACSASFPAGTAVALRPKPGEGSIFSGWSGGGCTGTGPCTVTMSAATAVTATFDLPPVALTVSKSGTGSGKIVSAPAGIKCGETCSASYPGSTTVTLTAKPGVGSVFTGWSGSGCSGTGTCIVSLSAATSVTANFAQ